MGTTASGRAARASAGSEAVAAEARDIVRRAAGDTAGKTIAMQIKRATENLGYAAAAWRIREAWYSRAGTWSAAALAELRERAATWRERTTTTIAAGPATLAQRVSGVRRLLTDLMRQVDELEAEVSRVVGQL